MDTYKNITEGSVCTYDNTPGDSSAILDTTNEY